MPIRAVEFYSAMIAQHNSIELHIFEHGDHSIGAGSGNSTLDAWPVLLESWLKNRRFLSYHDKVPTRTRSASEKTAGRDHCFISGTNDLRSLNHQ